MHIQDSCKWTSQLAAAAALQVIRQLLLLLLLLLTCRHHTRGSLQLLPQLWRAAQQPRHQRSHAPSQGMAQAVHTVPALQHGRQHSGSMGYWCLVQACSVFASSRSGLCSLPGQLATCNTHVPLSCGHVTQTNSCVASSPGRLLQLLLQDGRAVPQHAVCTVQHARVCLACSQGVHMQHGLLSYDHCTSASRLLNDTMLSCGGHSTMLCCYPRPCLGGRADLQYSVASVLSAPVPRGCVWATISVRQSAHVDVPRTSSSSCCRPWSAMTAWAGSSGADLGSKCRTLSSCAGMAGTHGKVCSVREQFTSACCCGQHCTDVQGTAHLRVQVASQLSCCCGAIEGAQQQVCPVHPLCHDSPACVAARDSGAGWSSVLGVLPGRLRGVAA